MMPTVSAREIRSAELLQEYLLLLCHAIGPALVQQGYTESEVAKWVTVAANEIQDKMLNGVPIHCIHPITLPTPRSYRLSSAPACTAGCVSTMDSNLQIMTSPKSSLGARARPSTPHLATLTARSVTQIAGE